MKVEPRCDVLSRRSLFCFFDEEIKKSFTITKIYKNLSYLKTEVEEVENSLSTKNDND